MSVTWDGRDTKQRWRRGAEVRLNTDGSIDEICVPRCAVHLEQMSDGFWWMGLTIPGADQDTLGVQFSVGRSGKHKARRIIVTAEDQNGGLCEGFRRTLRPKRKGKRGST